jgi:hypothetical protein
MHNSRHRGRLSTPFGVAGSAARTQHAVHPPSAGGLVVKGQDRPACHDVSPLPNGAWSQRIRIESVDLSRFQEPGSRGEVTPNGRSIVFAGTRSAARPAGAATLGPAARLISMSCPRCPSETEKNAAESASVSVIVTLVGRQDTTVKVHRPNTDGAAVSVRVGGAALRLVRPQSGHARPACETTCDSAPPLTTRGEC